ncbi:VOC family protein [Ohtaekwangia koreensis]|uniref:Glyoxalase/Bleomycin resistance protein/Dioxygenase superfamily protein n=1 Tax=Ohtaekwangia koreensis TaxID=688867 RepID=A0A1T5LF11_9BACT|nr:VOC family protein [Ohtaekwangia koreensis]SKC74616.1 Glyoxalase/Bleomycin resistance protein/Dioxygenase superfamily protein [Ohtaekwangia koreensis]
MKVSNIKETCLYFHDLEEAKKFYGEILELPVISYVAGKHIFFRAGSSVLLCFNPEDSKNKTSPPAHYGNGKLHFAFEVPDEEYISTKEEIKAKGISITAEVIWKSGKESFYFEDPQGNVLEVVPDKGIWD